MNSATKIALVFAVLNLFAFLPPQAGATALNVELTVKDHAGVDRKDAPATPGIPFPQGAAPSVNVLKITDGKSAIPAQFRSLVNWPDGSIKWVLCDFQANVAPNAASTYYLQDGGSGDSTGSSLKVIVSRNAVSVSTGAAQFVMSKKRFNLFERVLIAGMRTAKSMTLLFPLVETAALLSPQPEARNTIPLQMERRRLALRNKDRCA